MDVIEVSVNETVVINGQPVVEVVEIAVQGPPGPPGQGGSGGGSGSIDELQESVDRLADGVLQLTEKTVARLDELGSQVSQNHADLTDLAAAVENVQESVNAPVCPIPVGGFLSAWGNPTKFKFLGGEFVENGYLTPYSNEYAEAVRQAPKLAVYGSPDKVRPAINTSSYRPNVLKFNGVYISAGGGVRYSTNLSWWSNVADSYFGTPRAAIAASQAHLLMSGGAGAPLKYSVDGISCQAIPVSKAGFNPSVIAYGNGVWVAVSSLYGNANELSVCKSADPVVSTWTWSASNSGLSSVYGVAYGNGVWVAVGNTTVASYGIAVTADPAGWWRPVPNPTGKALSITGVVFTGELFVCLIDGRIFTSKNGEAWTERAWAETTNLPSNAVVSGTVSSTSLTGDLFSDGQGMVGYVMYNQPGLRRCIMRVSLDHGISWGTLQYWPAGTFGANNWGCWAGDRLLVGLSADQPVVDLGPTPFVQPDFVGLSYVLAPGEYVRVA